MPRKLCIKCPFYQKGYEKHKNISNCRHLKIPKRMRPSTRSLNRLEENDQNIQNTSIDYSASIINVYGNSPIPRIDDNEDFEKTSITISNFPDEILSHIFSFLPFEDLYYKVAKVCLRWKQIARDPFEWYNMSIDRRISTRNLLKMLKYATRLKKLEIKNRNDGNAILRQIKMHCPKINNVVLSNCRGSNEDPCVSFSTLMKTVIQHQKLKILLNEGTRVSAQPSNNSKIMKNYVAAFRKGEGKLNCVSIFKLSSDTSG